jgi:hypothetical protein
MVRIGSCGDDQAVYCTDIELVADDVGKVIDANDLNSFKFPNAAILALKGIQFMDDNHFISIHSTHHTYTVVVATVVTTTTFFATIIASIRSTHHDYTVASI